MGEPGAPCVCRWEHSSCLLLRFVCADGETWGPLCVQMGKFLLPSASPCVCRWGNLYANRPKLAKWWAAVQKDPEAAKVCVCVCVCVRAFSFCVWCACVASSASCGRSLRLLQVETCSALSTPNTWQSLSHWTSSFFCNTMVYAHCSLLKNTSFLGFSNLQEI